MSTSSDFEIKNLNVQKLKDTEGYPTWKARLSVALKAMMLWGIVDGRRLRNDVISTPEELAKWDKDNDRAMFYIMSSISDEVLMNSNMYVLGEAAMGLDCIGLRRRQRGESLPYLSPHHHYEDSVIGQCQPTRCEV